MVKKRGEGRSGRAVCPLCGKGSDSVHFPFCSRFCRSRDLNRWLAEGYVIPGDVEGDVENGDGGDCV